MSNESSQTFKDVHDSDDIRYTFSLGSVTQSENELQSKEGKVEPFESEIYPVSLYKTLKDSKKAIRYNLRLREYQRRRPFLVPRGR